MSASRNKLLLNMAQKGVQKEINEISDLTNLKKTIQNAYEDGTVVEQYPFSVFGWFWGIINFCYLLFRTLVDPNYNKHGDKYVRDFRPPGSGPPKPPSRKFGGFGPSSNGPPPPPMGGCGCG